MGDTARLDAWSAGDAYDLYMGRWSARVADAFLTWLAPDHGRSWIDVGCGTGALSAAILRRCAPRSLVGVDPSEAFVAHAARKQMDSHARFQTADGANLPFDRGRFDMLASGLVLNFIPDRTRALQEFRRVIKPGGTLSFYVWDYPGGGMGLIDAFWSAAAELDPEARDLDESARFPFCTADGLRALCAEAGLANAEVVAIEETSDFEGFDDFWHPFTLGAGPAPGYCAALPEDRRQRLHDLLRDRLGGGPFSLPARAWAVRAPIPA
ncbi:class I SAM-dependent methyltransferase [Seohaeicola saemankumensis]|nr:class I SAM-dependent methyltransferase [Seohaeicola saemankumensis]MCA0870952.1 class I SAM-dependent methyltransferase [Seohaeicola saemankumensis]